MRSLLVGALILSSCAADALAPSEGPIERIGRAYDQQTGTLVYTEHHLEVFESARLVRCTVTYRDREGERFASKSLDFGGQTIQPDFRLENYRTGHVEGVETNGASRVIEFRRNHHNESVEIPLQAPSDAIFDAGFDRFIELNWERLLSGENFTRDFLLPGRQDFVKFKITAADDPDPRKVSFELRLNSFLLGLFVDPIRVTYERDSRILLEYQGVSNLRDDDGRNMKVRIEFDEVEADYGWPAVE